MLQIPSDFGVILAGEGVSQEYIDTALRTKLEEALEKIYVLGGDPRGMANLVRRKVQVNEDGAPVYEEHVYIAIPFSGTYFHRVATTKLEGQWRS